MRQRMKGRLSQVDPRNLRQLSKLPLEELKGLPRAVKDQAAQALLNNPDSITRRRAEHRRDTWLLRGMGAPFRK
jgi:hypothetical protein